MCGSLRKRYKDSWNILLDVGYQPDSAAGKLKRRGELCELRWRDVDLTGGTSTTAQQLLKNDMPPLFGLPKNGLPRTIRIAPRTIDLLKRHKAHQAALQLANGLCYQDYGLVFARQWPHCTAAGVALGMPMALNHIGQDCFRRLIAQAGNRVITFHDLRHTCATLLLPAGVPTHMVLQCLGHKRIGITLGLQAHVLPVIRMVRP
jgi:integrase